MYSDEWDSNGLGECSRMRYIAFVRAEMKCKRHRFDEEIEIGRASCRERV